MAFRVWNFVPMTPIDWIGVGLGGSTSPIHITFWRRLFLLEHGTLNI